MDRAPKLAKPQRTRQRAACPQCAAATVGSCTKCGSDSAERQADEIGSRIGEGLGSLPGFSSGALPEGPRATAERHLGVSLAGTVLRNDQRAHESAFRDKALAVTEGSTVRFASGQFAPSTVAGRALIGHELTHVAQQRRAKAETKQKQPAGMSTPQGTSAPAPGSSPTSAVVNSTITPDHARKLDDNALIGAIDEARIAARDPKYTDAERESIRRNQQTLEGELRQRKPATARPPNTPPGGALFLAVHGVPAHLAETIPEGGEGFLPMQDPAAAPEAGLFSGPGQQSAAGGEGIDFGNFLTAVGLGFAYHNEGAFAKWGIRTAAGDFAIGLVGVPSFKPLGGRFVPQGTNIFGHTQLYVRFAGRIAIVRDFTIANKLAAMIRAAPEFFKGGLTATHGMQFPGAVTAGSPTMLGTMFSQPGAEVLEQSLSAAEAKRAMDILGETPVGPSDVKYQALVGDLVQQGVTPPKFQNCVFFAGNLCQKAGGTPPEMPKSKQGKFHEAAKSPPKHLSAGRHSRMLRVVKIAGKIMIPVGVAMDVGRVALAPEGERAKTAAKVVAGNLVGWGAAALTGFLCPPVVPVCWIVIAGVAYGASELAESVVDESLTPRPARPSGAGTGAGGAPSTAQGGAEGAGGMPGF